MSAANFLRAHKAWMVTIGDGQGVDPPSGILRIDQELAAETRRAGCPHCAGALHIADFPRKPRGCPAAVITEYSSRFSFTWSFHSPGSGKQRAVALFLRSRVHSCLTVCWIASTPVTRQIAWHRCCAFSHH